MAVVCAYPDAIPRSTGLTHSKLDCRTDVHVPGPGVEFTYMHRTWTDFCIPIYLFHVSTGQGQARVPAGPSAIPFP